MEFMPADADPVSPDLVSITNFVTERMHRRSSLLRKPEMVGGQYAQRYLAIAVLEQRLYIVSSQSR
jgi:hypothetical protein